MMRSTKLVLVMNLTALFCVLCSESKLVLATACKRVVYSLRLFLVSRCLNLFSLLRFVSAIAFLMFI